MINLCTRCAAAGRGYPELLQKSVLGLDGFGQLREPLSDRVRAADLERWISKVGIVL